MGKPRITVVVNKGEHGDPFEVLLYVNPEGRDRLVKELTDLNECSEHFHMMAPEWGLDDLSGTACTSEETVIPHLKILLRLDEWDTQYFPHVMKDDEANA